MALQETNISVERGGQYDNIVIRMSMYEENVIVFQHADHWVNMSKTKRKLSINGESAEDGYRSTGKNRTPFDAMDRYHPKGESKAKRRIMPREIMQI